MSARIGGMSRKASKFYEKTTKNPSWELSDADGSQGLLSGPSGLAGALVFLRTFLEHSVQNI